MMEMGDIIKTIILLLLVIMGFLMLVFLVQRFYTKVSPLGGHLKIKGSLSLDTKRKIVLVEHNDEKMLLFLGPHNDFLIPTFPLTPMSKIDTQGHSHEKASHS
jgi:flagellar biogenesis protein FliO